MSKYRIHVGKKVTGSNAVMGFLEKGRNDIIKGETMPVSVLVGTFGISNGIQGWGIRLDKDGKVPKTPLHVEDDNYRGEIKWVKWGSKENGATMIRGRWIPGYPTIDKDYQDSRLKVMIKDGFLDTGEPISFILLKHGYNDFDEEDDKGLVEILKIHHQNSKSISCNPTAERREMFEEVTEMDTTDQKTKLIETKGECLLIVSSASNDPDSVRKLFEIVQDANKAGSNINKEDSGTLYKWLQSYADEDPTAFSNKINKYKEKISATIEKAKSYELVDLTTDGFIAAREVRNGAVIPTGKATTIILDEVPAKGEEMFDWAFAHCLEPKVYEGMIKLQSITDNLK
jgi:hypothetical protein